MAKNRYIGDYPVIGIRPCIDGRRGPLKVRESLEEQTMGMAKAVKKLYEENLKYSNGEPVKVIIADTTIGRVAEAAACEAKFRVSGDSTQRSVRVPFILHPCSLHIHKKGFRRSVFTARTFRMRTIPPSPRTLLKSFCASDVHPLRRLL